MLAPLAGGLGVFQCEECFGVMCSTLQQSPGLDRMAYWGKYCFSLLSTLHKISLNRWIDCIGKPPGIFLGLKDWMLKKTVCYKCRSGACLPAGSWGIFEMYHHVRQGGVQTLTYYLAVFSGLILSQT